MDQLVLFVYVMVYAEKDKGGEDKQQQGRSCILIRVHCSGSQEFPHNRQEHCASHQHLP